MKVISSFKDIYDSMAYLDANESHPNVWRRETIDLTVTEAMARACGGQAGPQAPLEVQHRRIASAANAVAKASSVSEEEVARLFRATLRLPSGLRPFDDNNRYTRYPYYGMYLMFCGRIHYGLSSVPDEKGKRQRLWSQQTPESLASFFDNLPFIQRWHRPQNLAGIIQDMVDSEYDQRVADFLVDIGSPVALMYRGKLIVNPNLGEIGFAQRHGLDRVWTEIGAFIDNELSNKATVPPRPISDTLKAETKGFDAKTSFRKGGKKFQREKLDRTTW